MGVSIFAHNNFTHTFVLYVFIHWWCSTIVSNNFVSSSIRCKDSSSRSNVTPTISQCFYTSRSKHFAKNVHTRSDNILIDRTPLYSICISKIKSGKYDNEDHMDNELIYVNWNGFYYFWLDVFRWLVFYLNK